MRKLQSASALFVAIVVSTVALGQETEPTSPYEHLKSLEWLIGDWVREYTMPAGTPEWGEAGAKIQSRASFRWAPNKSFIILEGTDIVGGKPGSWMQERRVVQLRPLRPRLHLFHL